MEYNTNDENNDKNIIQKLLVARDAIKPEESLLHKILVTTKTQDRYVLRGEEVGRPSALIRLIDQYHLFMSSGMKIATGVFVLFALVGFSAYFVSMSTPQPSEVAVNTSTSLEMQQNPEPGALKTSDSIAAMKMAPATGSLDDIIAAFEADIQAEQSVTSEEEQDVLVINEESPAADDFGQTIDENSF
ncbi:MAG: hypothetical protein AAB783_01805 [Patescibacteria group bacterium]